MTYFGPRIIGNFKRPRAERLAEKVRDDHDNRDGNSKKHLAAIRKLVCCVPGCNVVGVDPHHLKSGTRSRGMGMRSPDKFAVPLCRSHHDEIERIGSRKEPSWFAKFGIDAIQLAGDLYSVTPRSDQMMRVVLAHKDRK